VCRSARQVAAQSFAHAQLVAVAFRDGGVHVAAGLFGGSEAAIGKHGFDVFARSTGDGDLEIVDRGRAVHGEGGREAAIHQIDEHGGEAAFHDVPAHSPDDRLRGSARGFNGTDHSAQAVGREHARESIEPGGHAATLYIRMGQVLEAHLAAALVDGNRPEPGEVQRLDVVLAHEVCPFLPFLSTLASAWPV
jgi:hypothetical protein